MKGGGGLLFGNIFSHARLITLIADKIKTQFWKLALSKKYSALYAYLLYIVHVWCAFVCFLKNIFNVMCLYSLNINKWKHLSVCL